MSNKNKEQRNGKGSKPRPLSVPLETYFENFDKVYKGKKKDENKKGPGKQQ